MCLKNVTWRAKKFKNPRSRDKWQVGYKIFEVNRDLIYSPFYNLDGTRRKNHHDSRTSLEIGKVYKNKVLNTLFCNIYDNNSESYLSGFHIFPEKMAAKLFSGLNQDYNRNIFEVKYRKVTAIGEHCVSTSYPVDCIIAQEMKIVRCLSIAEIETILKDEEKIDRHDRY